ncbi:MAG: hypothetical protein HN341_13520, partial [Verrucomicrobia bacterium]|nr:hypothetical protein [Verrucomicrobiota bacterium]
EIQAFKQVWWKAWGGNSDLSDHSRGFFPTEMAFSTEMIDVLVDEDYDWVIVPSHHISRTCPTYNDHADPEGSFQIKSSPPNRADQLGPSPTDGWWFAEPNPGQAAWNVSPYAYQLHRTQYVNPESGEVKSIIVVPSDDVLSYKAGYSGAEVGMVSGNISPYANDPERPVIVLPSTDGDNAWGGGSSSWNESTPSFFGACQGSGYNVCAIQDFVNQYGGQANDDDPIHVEPGAWIFPESAYGAPYFLKWIEPPLSTNFPVCYPGTQVDLETPGFALKFWSWAPVMTGANWCETAEQIWTDGGGSVDAWKIAHPYDNLVDGSWTSPNTVERAWHIYLNGLDSGFNYYGGLGNDDEVKQALATRRAIELLQTYMDANIASDATPPTVFHPQRFPWNPGGYTFGWFNRIPGGDENYLKKMPSHFYVWTHVYDVSGVSNVTLKVRIDGDDVNSLATTANEVYADSGEVGSWVTISMTMRELPSTESELNAAASNGDIDYFSEALPPQLADYYFAKIDHDVPGLSNYKGKLLDYYIEATDVRGNVRKTDIQHVFVEDDGVVEGSIVTFPDDPTDNATIVVKYEAGGSDLVGVDPVVMEASFDGGTNMSFAAYPMTNLATDIWQVDVMPTNNAPELTVWFRNASSTLFDSRDTLNWSIAIRDADAPTGPGSVTFSNAPVSQPVVITYHPNAGVLQGAEQIYAHIGFNDWGAVIDPDVSMSRVDANNWQYSVVPIEDATNINLVFNNGGPIWDNHSGNDWHFSVTGAAQVVVPPGVIITDPEAESVRMTNAITTLTLAGTAGSGVSGDLTWTNLQSAAGGIVSRTSRWAIASVPLVFGSNTITVSAAAVAQPATNAMDDAGQGAYADGWVSGDDGGIGWGGGWNLVGGDNAGHFRATVGSNPSLETGSPAFGLWANGGDLSEASRPFAQPLGTGQTLRVEFENGWVATNGPSVGVGLQNSAGEALFQCYFSGGEDFYRLLDGSGNPSTTVPYSTNGITIEFSLSGPSGYSALIDGVNVTGDLVSHSDQSIRRLRFWNYSAGSGDGHNVYFNDLLITDEAAGGVLQDSVAVYLVDPDNNIPAWWLAQHFGSGTADVARLDSDFDGHLNQHEYWLGTNPTNPASLLIVESVAVTNNDDFAVTWQAVGGRSYDVQYTDALSKDPVFDTVITVQEASVSNGVSTTHTFVDSISPPATNGARSYRIQLRR